MLFYAFRTILCYLKSMLEIGNTSHVAQRLEYGEKIQTRIRNKEDRMREAPLDRPCLLRNLLPPFIFIASRSIHINTRASLPRPGRLSSIRLSSSRLLRSCTRSPLSRMKLIARAKSGPSHSP